MSRLDDLMLVEQAGKLTPEWKQELDTLRAANQSAKPAEQSEQSIVSKVAAMPAQGWKEIGQLVGGEQNLRLSDYGIPEIPYVSKGIGLAAKGIGALLPETPAGWGGMAASLAVPGAGLLPAVARMLAASSGGMLASGLAGEKSPIAEGFTQGAAQGLGEAAGGTLGWLGGVAGRAIRSPLMQNKYTGPLVNAIRNYLPGLSENPTGQELSNFISGKQGLKALQSEYADTLKRVETAAGEAVIADPKAVKILSEYFPEDFGIKLSKGMERAAGGIDKLLAEQPEKAAIPVTTAMEYARKLAEQGRSIAEKRGVTRAEIQTDNIALRNAIGDTLNAAKEGLGSVYKEMNERYWKGKVVDDFLTGGMSDAARASRAKILTSTPRETKINFNELNRAVKEDLPDLLNIGADDLIKAAMRGQPAGTGPGKLHLPVWAYGGGLHAKFPYGIETPNLPPLTSGEMMPRIGGYAAQKLSDWLRILEQNQGAQ